jgi:hypothetical protein
LTGEKTNEKNLLLLSLSHDDKYLKVVTSAGWATMSFSSRAPDVSSSSAVLNRAVMALTMNNFSSVAEFIDPSRELKPV